MAGFSNITGDESIMFADNASFDGTERGGKLTTDGQLWIGSTSSPHVRTGSLTAGTGITISNGAGTISISTNGAVVPNTITGNTGGALSPTAGNWNVIGVGSITNSGAGSTLTVQLTGLTNHNILVGAGTTTITNVAPSATSGIPLVSNGAAADPSFTTAVVAGGGTGAVTFTAYSVICAGTTATGAFQNVSGVGTAGQVLTSNGASALPTWQASGLISNVTTPGAYPYTTLTTDYVILVDTSAARTITPLGSPVTGQTYRIKDNVGSAAANNITITPSGKNIDGAASTVINIAYGSVDICYNGTQWIIL